MSNSTDTNTDGGTFAGRIKQTSSGVLRFMGLVVFFFALAMLGAGILGPGTGLKAWIVILIVAFSIVS